MSDASFLRLQTETVWAPSSSLCACAFVLHICRLFRRCECEAPAEQVRHEVVGHKVVVVERRLDGC
jgi:hypothetical protein